MAFRSAVCGIDGSREAVDAVRQAVRLVASDGKVVLVGVVDPWQVLMNLRGRDPQQVSAEESERAEADLDDAAAAVPAGMRVERRVLKGSPGTTLIEETIRQEGDLLVVGSHGRSRRRGILLGSVASFAAHQGPCPVLITRPADTSAFPTGIVAGVDGSDEGWEAWRVATDLADECSAPARAILVARAKDDIVATVRERLADIQLLEGHPAAVLAEDASPDELLVLGARGLGGILALGSVSERVAHQARCSVLIVRSSHPHRFARPVANAADVMSAPPLVIDEDASLEEAALLMLAHASEAVVVVDADGAVSGVLSEADFAGSLTIFHPQGAYSTDVIRMPKLFGQWLAENDLERLAGELRKARVGDVMRSEVVVATPHEALQPILERMLRDNLPSVPVVRDGRPIGVVSARALLRLMAKGAHLNQSETESVPSQ